MVTSANASPELVHPQVAPPFSDKWLFWPMVATVGTVAGLTFLCGLPGLLSFILIPLSVLGYLIAAVTLFVLACWLVARKRFRKAASIALALFVPVLLWVPIGWATECLHLALTAEFGMGVLGSAPGSTVIWPSSSTSANPQFRAYDWSVGLAGGTSTFLIYDPTDEIALPLAPLNVRSLENGFGEYCAGRVRHLLGHYYVCVIG